MKNFQSGPFEYRMGQHMTLNSQNLIKWHLLYNDQEVGEKLASAAAGQSEILEALSDARSDWVNEKRKKHMPDAVNLVHFETGNVVASIATDRACGMSAGMIDDSSEYWLQSSDRMLSRRVSLQLFTQLSEQHGLPVRAWIAGMLSGEVLCQDPEEWRAPTAWEIRHVVGEGSLTGISGAKAAGLIGISPQNFRKYTAQDSAKHRQTISFAAWRLLLAKLQVQKIE